MGLAGAAPIGIAGAGPVAQALGRALRERGALVAAVASRELTHAAAAAAFVGGAVAVSLEELPRCAERILIAVSDGGIKEVAGRLAAGMRGGVALHTCGAHGPEILAALGRRGVACGALHPLQTFPNAEAGARALTGATFGITASGAAREWADEIVALLGGVALTVAEDRRAEYHAAGVLASNYTVGVLHAAAAALARAGISEAEGLAALAPLVRASVENALKLGPAAALTGPVVRGDAGTVARHRAALDGRLAEFYAAGARYLLEVAKQRGLDGAAVRRIEELLEGTGNE